MIYILLVSFAFWLVKCLGVKMKVMGWGCEN